MKYMFYMLGFCILTISCIQEPEKPRPPAVLDPCFDSLYGSYIFDRIVLRDTFITDSIVLQGAQMIHDTMGLDSAKIYNKYVNGYEIDYYQYWMNSYFIDSFDVFFVPNDQIDCRTTSLFQFLRNYTWGYSIKHYDYIKILYKYSRNQQ